MERLEQQQAFVDANGWGDADIFPLPSDASTRRYIRLARGNESCMLVDAPPETEKLAEFIQVGAYLAKLGLRVPGILAVDLKEGLALLEDFGDSTFTVLLAAGESEKRLYEAAVDVLIHIRQNTQPATEIDLPPYDMDLMLEEVSRFLRWYVPAVRGSDVTEAEKEAFLAAWETALSEISKDTSSFVFRDFHVDNLMILPDGDGVSSVGLLDFQDALQGSPLYDLMSLVRDARRDVPAETEKACIDRYFSAFRDIDQTEALNTINLLSAQRQTKIAGIFARLATERDMTKYLEHLPRIRSMIKRDLSAPALQPVWRAIKAILPTFENDEIELP